jgi:hypothetical protein
MREGEMREGEWEDWRGPQEPEAREPSLREETIDRSHDVPAANVPFKKLWAERARRRETRDGGRESGREDEGCAWEHPEHCTRRNRDECGRKLTEA